MIPTALTIAGSDSGGGAGIQADLKTFAAHEVYGMSVICAVTAQNTVGVTRIDPIRPAAVAAQLDAIFADLPVGAFKIGMLGDAQVATVVAGRLAGRRPVVVDPVMVATSGDRLADIDAVVPLLALSTLLTPNRREATIFAGGGDPDAWARAQPSPILVTGGDGAGDEVVDTLYLPRRPPRSWRHARIAGGPFHGTGCTLSSAIAARLARGEGLIEAVEGAIGWVHAQIADAAAIGSGSRVLLHRP